MPSPCTVPVRSVPSWVWSPPVVSKILSVIVSPAASVALPVMLKPACASAAFSELLPVTASKMIVGAVVSIATYRLPDAVPVLPAASVASAVMLCEPSDSAVVV